MSVNKPSDTIFKRRLNLWIYLFLTLATLIVYWQVTNHGFVNYDDDPAGRGTLEPFIQRFSMEHHLKLGLPIS